ncbi:MAG: M48 family metallopeptidase [Verrucomicrobia bacterium]|nr:M48 family metallopeptidase [Verrucomicrobiota bacterium]MDA1066742.1 M48 family metallopeptidase [Verrucomicrobiota bacterium]
MHWLLTTFLLLLILNSVKSLVLDLLNARNIRANAGKIPDAYAGVMEEETYAKSVAYSLEKTRFSIITSLYGSIILALVILGGFLPWMWHVLEGFWGASLWAQAGYLVVVTLVLSIPDMPFDWYSTFKLEEKYGFNKSTLGLWISDKVKGTLIGFVIGYPLICLLLKLVDWLGSHWWIWGFVVIFVFQLAMMVLYPKLIMPLFNKLEPLEPGELKDQLMDLSDSSGFAAKTIEVMDGSKRSGHSNAFFTGFGKFRRIVLFDTLMEQLETNELKAVLAHEIGHYKRGHVPKMVAMSAAGMLLAFWAIAFLAKSSWFYAGFGFEGVASIAPAFLLFSIMSGLITSWLTPVFSILSRKHEYEADAFARDAMGEYHSLIGALRKLNEKNLSNLTPHPIYSAFYYSHPTLLERESAMKGET